MVIEDRTTKTDVDLNGFENFEQVVEKSPMS